MIGDCAPKYALIRCHQPLVARASQWAPACSRSRHTMLCLIMAAFDHGRDAWNWLVDQHWRIMFIGLRDWEWILITASYNRYTGATMQESLLGNTSTRPVLMLAAACILPKRYPG